MRMNKETKIKLIMFAVTMVIVVIILVFYLLGMTNKKEQNSEIEEVSVEEVVKSDEESVEESIQESEQLEKREQRWQPYF